MSIQFNGLSINLDSLQGIDLAKIKSGKAAPEDIARLIQGIKDQASFSAALTTEQAAQIAASITQQALQATDGENSSALANMKAALEAIKARNASAPTYYNTQALGQEDEGAQTMLLNNETGESSSTSLGASEETDSVVEEFLKYMRMTPEERLLAQILGEEGMTMEEFAALSPEDQQKILAKVRARIEEAIKQEEERKQQATEQASQVNQVFVELRSGNHSGEQKGSGLFKDGRISLDGILKADATDETNAQAATPASEDSPAIADTAPHAEAPLGRRRRAA